MPIVQPILCTKSDLPSLAGLGKMFVQWEESFLGQAFSEPSTFEHRPMVCPTKMEDIF